MCEECRPVSLYKQKRSRSEEADFCPLHLISRFTVRDFQYNEEEMKADKEEMTRLSTDKKKQFVSDRTGNGSTPGSFSADLFKEAHKCRSPFSTIPFAHMFHYRQAYFVVHTIHFSYVMKINLQRLKPCMRKVHYSEDLVTLFYNKVFCLS